MTAMAGRLVLWGAHRDDKLPAIFTGMAVAAGLPRDFEPLGCASFERDLVSVAVPLNYDQRFHWNNRVDSRWS